METEIIDKLFLELSQISRARTRREVMLIKRVEDLESCMDLMVDEFKRIKACPGVSSEIKGLCDRAVWGIKQAVPLIVQRDQAEEKIRELTATIEKLTAEVGNWKVGII